MTVAPTPAEVMLSAAKASLRAGRLPPTAVIHSQLTALAKAGYRLQPSRPDGGADLLRTAARLALRTGRFAPAVVIAVQLTELQRAGYAFVGPGQQVACASFEWGPKSFQECPRCGLSFWKHAEGSGLHHAHHRSEENAQ